MSKHSVLLLGESCTDEYKTGIVERLSPEAPIPVLKNVETTKLLGMAANVQKNLANLGVDPDFITNSGEIIKTRYIDQRSGQHILRVDQDPEIAAWSNRVFHPMEDYDAVVISDYNKGFLSYESIEQLINKYQGPIFIDTKKTDLHRFNRPNVYLKINEIEYKNRRSDVDNLIVTLGSRGAVWIRNDKESYFPARPVDIVDVCGCGDTFLAALSAEYLYTEQIESAIIFANKAASLTAQHRGNYAPSYQEVNNA